MPDYFEPTPDSPLRAGQGAPAADSWHRFFVWLPWTGLAALVAALSLQKIRAFDYWWHLRTGQWIVENRAIPTADMYTYTVLGNRWIDIHWLHQVGVYGLYALGGHAGVVIGKLVLVALWVAALAPIGFRRGRPALSAFVLGWMLLVAAERIMPRPELPTFVCLAAVLLLLDRFVHKPDRGVYAVVLVQLVWVNLHGLFALGIAVCAIYLVTELLGPFLRPGTRIDGPRVRRLGAVTALALLASLGNPNGLEGALYPIQQLAMIGGPEDRGLLGSLILELVPPISTSRSLATLPMALFGGLALASFAAMLLNWRRLHGADPLLWVAFLYLALGAQRNAALFAIVAAPMLVRNANAVLDARATRGRAWLSPRVAPIAVSSLLLLVSVDAARGTLFDRLGSVRVAGFGTLDFLYPVGAVDWIERHRPPGPIFHHMADGGYLGWRLYPDYAVMVDGRLEVFGEQRFMELQVPGSERFRELDAEYHFGAALLHYSLIDTGDLLWWLHLNTNWRLVFVDETAALFVRVPAGEISPFPEIDPEDRDLFPDAGTAGRIDRLRRFARTQFLVAIRRYEDALTLWQDTLERYPDLPEGEPVLATLLHRNGLVAAAEAILRRRLAEDPDDPALHLRIGDLRFEAGDHADARAHYDAALDLDRSLTYALLRRGQLAELAGDPSGAAQYYFRVVAQSEPLSPASTAARERLRALGLPSSP